MKSSRSSGWALVVLGTISRLVAAEPVTVTEDEALFTWSNSLVTAMVAKTSGDLVSVRYQGMELLATRLDPHGRPDLELDPPGANPKGLNPGMTDHQYGFWSHDAMGPRGAEPAVARITIDPRVHDGAFAEVSVKGVARNRNMGTGPGARPDGQFAADVEIRYAMERGQAGISTYAVFEHRPESPASSLGEARFCAKLAELFDWMGLSPRLHRAYPQDLREGDKYIYTVVQSENPAFGWSSAGGGATRDLREQRWRTGRAIRGCAGASGGRGRAMAVPVGGGGRLSDAGP